MAGVTLHGCLLLFCVARGADDPATLLSRAATAYQAEDFAKSAGLYEAAIKAGAGGAGPAYNAACCYARLGQVDDAFAWLDRAFEAGWRDVEHLRADSDLTSLHADARWSAAVRRCQALMDAFIKTLKEPALREELLKRMREDQRIRMSADPDMSEWQRIDAENTAYMKTVIDKYGWPGKSMVGDDGALAAFLLIQHADTDTAFQKRCLKLLTDAVEREEAKAAHMAYLTDRVLVAEGKPQRYGTQFHPVDGVSVPFPIEDEAHVDARRKEVGLESLEEYAKRMRSLDRD